VLGAGFGASAKATPSEDHLLKEPEVDYRDSHLNRGDTYDETIAAKPFDAYMARCEADYLRETVPRILGEGGRYLDFACGTGRITATVSRLVGESVGVDISQGMLSEARRKCPLTRFVCVDLTRENVDLGQFDLVTSFRFFGNAQDELRSSALDAISRLVRKGGHLIINSHRNPHSIGAILQAICGHRHGMDLGYSKITRMLRDHGFRIVAVRPIGFWVFRAAWRRETVLNSRGADFAERVFRHRILAPISSDVIIVARKR